MYHEMYKVINAFIFTVSQLIILLKSGYEALAEVGNAQF